MVKHRGPMQEEKRRGANTEEQVHNSDGHPVVANQDAAGVEKGTVEDAPEGDGAGDQTNEQDAPVAEGERDNAEGEDPAGGTGGGNAGQGLSLIHI